MANDVKKIRKTLTNSRINNATENLISSLVFANHEHASKAISILSPENGDGKSTVALNLAVSLSKKGANVLIVDSDINNHVSAEVLNCENKYGIIDVLLNKCKIEEAIIPTLYKNLYFLDFTKDIYSISELLYNDIFNNMFQVLKNNFDYIIVDTSSTDNCVESLGISKIVDSVIIVIKENKTKEESISNLIDQLKLIKANILGLVLTHAKI